MRLTRRGELVVKILTEITAAGIVLAFIAVLAVVGALEIPTP